MGVLRRFRGKPRVLSKLFYRATAKKALARKPKKTVENTTPTTRSSERTACAGQAEIPKTQRKDARPFQTSFMTSWEYEAMALNRPARRAPNESIGDQNVVGLQACKPQTKPVCKQSVPVEFWFLTPSCICNFGAEESPVGSCCVGKI